MKEGETTKMNVIFGIQKKTNVEMKNTLKILIKIRRKKRRIKFHNNQKEDDTLKQDKTILPMLRLETTGMIRSGSTGTYAFKGTD